MTGASGAGGKEARCQCPESKDWRWERVIGDWQPEAIGNSSDKSNKSRRKGEEELETKLDLVPGGGRVGG